MGKGDKKTRRGKLFSGSFGVLRARKKKSGFSVISSTKKVVAEKVTPAVEEPIPAIKEAKQNPVKQPKKPVVKKDPSPKETAKKEK